MLIKTSLNFQNVIGSLSARFHKKRTTKEKNSHTPDAKIVILALFQQREKFCGEDHFY